MEAKGSKALCGSYLHSGLTVGSVPNTAVGFPAHTLVLTVCVHVSLCTNIQDVLWMIVTLAMWSKKFKPHQVGGCGFLSLTYIFKVLLGHLDYT